MDLTYKYKKEWQELLQAGDRVIACIRHKTDGEKNIHGANVIVIDTNHLTRKITGFYNNEKIAIDWNELTEIK